MNDMKRTDEEAKLVETARRVLPAGTFGNMAADIVIREGRGPRVWDVSGNEYIDYLLGSGPMFAGHAHPEVNAAVSAQLARGTPYLPASITARRISAQCPAGAEYF